ncbi:MAG: ABC transporter substrate-binding protein [Burkholderiales bacterium PBB4]|nr:MAG: ABC transporter substrate-binding protein [Burkholderiales bacterium PBB4]
MPTPLRCALWALGWLVGAGVQAAACVKSLRWSDMPPYAFKDPQGTIQGLHVDLAREALKRVGCDARLVEMPWARALMELERGRLDLLPGAADTPERAAFAFFSRPTNSARTVLFVARKTRHQYRLNTLADIMGTDFRLAVRRGSTYGAEYDALLPNPEFVKRLTFVTAPQSGMRMMAAGRVDGHLGDELAGLHTIQTLGLSDAIQRSKLVTSKDADHIAFSKVTHDAAFVQRFNAALGRMVEDGTTKRLLERYLPCPVSVEKLGCQ